MKNTIFGIICLLCSAFALNAADPSAQGTIVITEVKLDTGTTTGGFTAKGSVTANATWSASGIVLFAMKNAGGYIYTFTTTNTPPAIGDDPNTTKWTATGNLPTGTFTIWAQCAVKKFTDEQKIGTALSELVVANSSAANKETLLSVTYSASSPSRNTGMHKSWDREHSQSPRHTYFRVLANHLLLILDGMRRLRMADW
jgi:hypothetical protein